MLPYVDFVHGIRAYLHCNCYTVTITLLDSHELPHTCFEKICVILLLRSTIVTFIFRFVLNLFTSTVSPDSLLLWFYFGNPSCSSYCYRHDSCEKFSISYIYYYCFIYYCFVFERFICYCLSDIHLNIHLIILLLINRVD